MFRSDVQGLMSQRRGAAAILISWGTCILRLLRLPWPPFWESFLWELPSEFRALKKSLHLGNVCLKQMGFCLLELSELFTLQAGDCGKLTLWVLG